MKHDDIYMLLNLLIMKIMNNNIKYMHGDRYRRYRMIILDSRI